MNDLDRVRKIFAIGTTVRLSESVELDIVDRLKVLFGRCLKIETKIIVPQEHPIERYNAVSNTSIISSTGNFIKQDRPPFGYVSSKDF